MINANELRLGNWVFDTSLKTKEQVEVISDGAINGYCGRMGFEPDDIEDFNPIPLTEDWLKRFGFKDNDNYNWDRDNEFNKYKLNDWACDEFNGQGYIFNNIGLSESPLIKHVHTLQNLYFALTGEELKIKEA